MYLSPIFNTFFSGMGQFMRNFTPEQEQEIVDYMQVMESKLFGLTTKDLRKQAYQLTQKNKLPHGFKQRRRINRPSLLLPPL
jgi:hypothetical protein